MRIIIVNLTTDDYCSFTELSEPYNISSEPGLFVKNHLFFYKR